MMRVRAAFIAGLAALAVAAPAQADVWNVTNGSSDATAPACNVDLHTCVSLRTALAASEATKDVPDTINVPAGTININNDLVIQSDITVVGTSARTSIIDGGFKYRGFRIMPSGNAKISHFTIRNGAATQADTADGGGILNLSGVAQLAFIRVTTSQAGAGGSGGGIANVQGTMTMSKVLVDNNTAANGAGVANIGGVETPDRGLLGLVDSTVFKNTAGLGGTGGIDSRGGQGNVVILNRSTVADNVGGVRGMGGLQILSGAAQALTSIVARNLAAGETANCGDVKPTSSSNNVENQRECGFDTGGVNPGLATALSNAGGELDVLALLSGSPAVDRGAAGACGTNATDQRGLLRPQGTACDAGAFEFDQAPTVTISSGPTGTINTSSASFTFSTPEPGVTYRCRLTGPGQPGTFVPCAKPGEHGYGGLGNGSYTFSVRALDGVFGDPPTASRSFTIVLLDTTITGGPSGPTNDTTPTFTFASDEAGVTFLCSLDGGEFAACPSPFMTAALAEGAHVLEVRASDASGNVDPSPASRSFTVDLTPPAPPTVESGPAGPTTETSPAFAFSATETVSCRRDGPAPAVGTFGECASPKSFGVLSPGDYVFIVRSVDAAGNANETRRGFTVTAPQPAQPTPTPSPSPTPTPVPTPTAQTVVVQPAGGTVLVRLPGTSTFVALDVSKGIPFGSEVDARKGKVRLTALPTAGKPPETADFFDGLFTIHKVGGYIELRLSEKLTGCPKAKKSGASAAQKKKPKSRKLWGDGKGKFRTKGSYSAATVRGTRWLVQDMCTSTLTRVTLGVVAVNDFAQRKTVLVKKGKRYIARAKR